MRNFGLNVMQAYLNFDVYIDFIRPLKLSEMQTKWIADNGIFSPTTMH